MLFSLRFFLGFLRNPLRNASVVPSSRFLTRKMLDGLDFSKISTVVELGPGTGVFTREILRRARPGTKVLLVELNTDFAAALAREFGDRVFVENASAADFEALLAKRGLGRADLVVSGLGLPAMPVQIRESILSAVARQVGAGAEFRMFTYVLGTLRKLAPNTRFRRLSGTWLNLPPASVVTIEI